MNPLSSSSLNIERSRLESARAASAHEAAGADASGGAGGFAGLLKGAQTSAAAQPLSAQGQRVPEAVATHAQISAAGDPARSSTDAVNPQQQSARAMQEARNTQRQSQQQLEARRAEAAKAQPQDRAIEDTDTADKSEDIHAQTDGSSACPGDTLAHWLLGQGLNVVQPSDGTLPPPQNPAPGSDDLQAAALAREVLDAVRGRAKASAANEGQARAAQDKLPSTKADALMLDAKGIAAQAAAGDEPNAAALAGAEKKATGERRAGASADEFGQALGNAQVAAGGTAPATPVATPTAVVPSERVIETPAHHPAFGEAVGVTISQLVRDGVHEAHLQLNPAELGPVSVHIAMQGNEARLELGAAQADTRALLDASMPALAEAMRADGLVLAGSQVSEWRAPDNLVAGNSTLTPGSFAGGGGGEGAAAGRDQAGGGGGQARDGQARAADQVPNWAGVGPGRGSAAAPAQGRSGLGGLDLYA